MQLMSLPTTVNTTVNDLLTQLTMRLKGVNDVHHVCVSTCEVLAEGFGVSAVVLLRAQNEPYYFNAWLSRPYSTTVQMHLRQDEEIIDYLTARPLFTINAQDVPFLSADEHDLIGAPLDSAATDMALIGAVCILDDNVQTAESLLPIIATHIIPYIERAHLYQVITQQRILFEVVNDITVSLTSTLSLRDIYDRVTNPIRRILNVQSVSIGLVDRERKELVFVPELLDQAHSLRVALGEGIAGWVVENEETVMTNDPYADERFLRDVDDQTGFETRSMLAVPLKHNGRVIGVLEGLNKLSGNFSLFDRQLVESISGPLAIALENANLHADVLAEKRRVETIFSSMSEGLLTFDAAGTITGVNDALLSMLQLTDVPAAAYTVFDLVQTEDENSIRHFVQAVFDTPEETEPPQMTCNLRTHYAEEFTPALVSGASIRNHKGILLEAVLVFSDLRQVREVERMRDDFFSNIVHELRTPLATILMYARLLRKDVGQGATETNTRYIDTIAMESDRLQTMVRSMLALARLEAQEIQRSDRLIDVKRIFADIVPALTQRALEKGITIDATIDHTLPPVCGDRDVLYSAVKNLLDNAVKFTPAGKVTVTARGEKEHIVIDIADTGIGIPEEAMPSLFKRFFRASTAVEQGIAGTGLGLYMVKEGVERHRGTITVNSVVGQGTSFHITLPAHTA